MSKSKPIDTHIHLDYEPEMNKFFNAAIKVQASDLHIKVGQPPKLRVAGVLKKTTSDIMTQEKMEKLVYEILSQPQKEYFLEKGSIDFAHEMSNDDRFRVNIYRQRGTIALVARRVSSDIPPFETLNLPPILEQVAERQVGLILVVGATGSGKSTTIASMIDHINDTRACHIVTIEDPVEYLHKDKKANVSQREIGIDVPDFDEALKNLMRQDPDVVLIGEMRDAETVTAAMRAAETGHLVFGTMHSANAAQSVQRLLDLFPPQERPLARQTLSLIIQSIVSQVLLPGIKEGISRVPAVEILLANSTVRKLISEEREADLPSVIRSCESEGMQDFTHHLCKLIKEGFVDPKEAFKYAPNIEELKMALKGIRTSSSSLL